MVDVEYIARAAMRAYRATGAAIARATLRALGIQAPPRVPPRGTVVSFEAYTEMAGRSEDLIQCFEIRESTMDGRAWGR